MTDERREPLSDPLGVYRQSIRFVSFTVGSIRLSDAAAAYLSNWNPEVRGMHTLPFISLTTASEVRIRLFQTGKYHSIAPLRCTKFVRYEGSMTMIGINVVGLMMFLRYVPVSPFVNSPR